MATTFPVLIMSALIHSVCSLTVTEVIVLLAQSNRRHWNLHAHITHVDSQANKEYSLDYSTIHHHQFPITIAFGVVPTYNSGHTLFSHTKIIVLHVVSTQTHLPTGFLNCFYCFAVLVFTDTRLLTDFEKLPTLRRVRHKLLCVAEGPRLDKVSIFVETPMPNEYGKVSLRIGKTSEKLFNLKRSSFRNANLRLAAFKSEPFIVVDDEGKRSSGLSIEAFRAASASFNFTYEMVSFPRKYFKHTNGTWGGIIGALAEDRVDFICGSTAATSERLKLLTYGTYGFYYELTFITMHPTLNRPRNAFLHPFMLQVWTCLLILMACLTLGLILIARAYGLRNAILAPPTIVVAVLLAQSMRASRPLRAPLVFWILGSVLISNYYCSNLLSHLTHPLPNEVPRSFESLSERTDFTIEMIHVPGITAHVFFNKTRIPAIVAIRERYSLTLDHIGCVVRAATIPNSACIGGTDNLLPLVHRRITIHKEHMPVLFAEQATKWTFLHSVLPKNSKYLEAVDFITGWTRDTGLVSKWFTNVLDYYHTLAQKWFRTDDGRKVARVLQRVADSMGDTSVRPFGYRHLEMAFGVVMAGTCGAAALLFLERAVFRMMSWARWVSFTEFMRSNEKTKMVPSPSLRSKPKPAWIE